MNSLSDTVIEYVTAPENERSTIGVDFKHIYDNFVAIFVLYDEDSSLCHIGTGKLDKDRAQELIERLDKYGEVLADIASICGEYDAEFIMLPRRLAELEGIMFDDV